jgi:hypothetical protein
MASIHLQFPWFGSEKSNAEFNSTVLISNAREVPLGKYRVTGADAVIALRHWLHTGY